MRNIIIFCTLAFALSSCSWKAKIESYGFKYPDIPVYKGSDIQSPDIQISINQSTIKSCIEQIIDEGLTFPLHSDTIKSLSNDYVQINELIEFKIDTNSTLLMRFKGSAHFKKLFSRINLTINEIAVNAVPKIIQENSKFYLSLDLAVTYIDIDDVSPIFEKGLANLVITNSYKKKPFKEDISDNLIFEIPSPFDDSENINPKPVGVGIKIDSDKLILVYKI